MDSQTALKQLNDYRATAKSGEDIYKQTSQELGVGASQQRAQELRNLISGTEQALRGVESSVTGRTQGSLVTEAQRARLANIERAPIADQFNTQQGALSNEQNVYQNLLTEAGTRAGLTYGSQQDKLRSLESGYQLSLEEEFKRRQAEEQKRQFDAQLAQERSKAQKNTYDIQDLIARIMGTGKYANNQPNNTNTSGIPKLSIDYSRGLDLSKALTSGAFSGALGGLRF